VESRTQRAEEDITAIMGTVMETRDDVKQLERDVKQLKRDSVPAASGAEDTGGRGDSSI
jgi:hypothetical protein